MGPEDKGCAQQIKSSEQSLKSVLGHLHSPQGYAESARGHLLLRRAFGGSERRHDSAAWLDRFPGLRIFLYQLNNKDV